MLSTALTASVTATSAAERTIVTEPHRRTRVPVAPRPAMSGTSARTCLHAEHVRVEVEAFTGGIGGYEAPRRG
jgi:hypothetical protein